MHHAYDVFLSHSAADKDTVRPIAERLRADGLKVWFDEWEIKPGDNISSRIESGLEEARILILCMSKNAFDSDWVTLESQTFRFRDPLNKDRRFIPLKLDDAPAPGSLAQFLHVDWRNEVRERSYEKLVDACGPSMVSVRAGGGGVFSGLVASGVVGVSQRIDPFGRIELDLTESPIRTSLIDTSTKWIYTGGYAGELRKWNTDSGQRVADFSGHEDETTSIAQCTKSSRLASGSKDGTVRIWDSKTGKCLTVIGPLGGSVRAVAFAGDGSEVLVSHSEYSVTAWDVATGDSLRGTSRFSRSGLSLDVSKDGRYAVVATFEGFLQIIEMGSDWIRWGDMGFGGAPMTCVAFGVDSVRVLSASSAGEVRIFNKDTGVCEKVWEGHTDCVNGVAWSPTGSRAVSVSDDRSCRVWDVDTGFCEFMLDGHNTRVWEAAWIDDNRLISVDEEGVVCKWDLSQRTKHGVMGTNLGCSAGTETGQVRYTNAKVLLVGDSGAGKTGLSNRLAHGTYTETDSTVGAWSTRWPLRVDREDDVEREIWLWDFGGQADQRLIHQLYMNQTHLAALVFDPQKKGLFDTLGTWDRDLARAATKDFKKLLVAGRVDAGGLRSVSRAEVEDFAAKRGFAGFLETSAKEDTGCEELKAAIADLIDWDAETARSTPILFKRIKEEIVQLKDEGRVLMRFNELRDALQLRLSDSAGEFADAVLKTVLTLLSGPGVVWELGFGFWILLQPEQINAHAQAVIRTLQQDDREMGCITEERVLQGELAYAKDGPSLEADEKRILLLAMHQILVERGLCLRDADPACKSPTMLVFPSYARRERQELVEYPSVIVSYQFEGFLDDIYATLVVRLHHTGPFDRDELWRDAADFKTLSGARLGVKLTRRADGAGELEVYFDPEIPAGEMMIFSKYVHEHLLRKAAQVERLRHWVCTCGEPVENRATAMRRLKEKGKEATILCVACEKRVTLWDVLEERYGDPEIQLRVRELEAESKRELDNESKERALVGDAICTASLAGQICRELTVCDHGIDMEIEFKHDSGSAAGTRIYLQLKSGNSYLRSRKKDGTEVFDIKNENHIEYWQNQPGDVWLVIRQTPDEDERNHFRHGVESEPVIRWMNITRYLQEREDKSSKQVIFKGEPFDVMSVRRRRAEALGLEWP